MNKINLFAIRIKDTELYKGSRHATFETYGGAMENGVYFNKAASAEKVIKETMNGLTAQKGYTINHSRYEVYDEVANAVKYYTFFKEVAENDNGYLIEFKPMELEVVTLSLTPAV